ncbi:hypothetical protein FGE12_00650 [Aggregicoccus sp. 17bor-14]|uniref:hypothetical protein n=1 Tax=Myxococcaceae TaxID=31 RepID=UPI00129CF5EA|nr:MULTISPECIES: hypothetical protein [Myxococcaceae]MBF5040881.1 hypothetical protein [Simulacricoccus sp. 17bor-14]MRI86670.1 hypothetical protein [Aggregicoccus sp. 17bor-14]
MKGRLTLSAVARGDRTAAIARIEEAISACGWLVAARPFSGLYFMFQAELETARLGDFAQRLRAAGVMLDEVSAALLEAAEQAADTPRNVSLGVTFPEGDPNLRHVIPEVPG